MFDTEAHARATARQLQVAGVTADDIRVADSLDALASVRGEMQEEAVEVAGTPTGPYPRSARRGFAIGTVVGAVVGVVIALPFAALPIGSLTVGARLLLFALIGLGFGAFLGWFLGGAFGLDRPEEPVAAAQGATLAVPDSDVARMLLVRAAPLRVDLVSADGEPVGRLGHQPSGPSAILADIARHAREEPTEGPSRPPA